MSRNRAPLDDCRNRESLLRCYESNGFSMIPIVQGSKRPIQSWKESQVRRASPQETMKWLQDGHGLGVVCGRISDNLVVRDFDKPQSYDQWKTRNKGLAAELPTVETRRGFHVYARLTEHAPATRILADGELRGEGGYVVAPPTKHVGGNPYRWRVPLGQMSPLPLSCLDFGTTECVHATERRIERQSNPELTRDIQSNTEQHIEQHKQLLLPISVAQEVELESAISATIPAQHGQRHHKVFEFG